LKRRLAWVTAGYFAVIALVVVAVLPFAVYVLHIENRIQHNLEPSAIGARRLVSLALDEETGERGYLITGDRSFLAPYNAGREQEATVVQQLAALPLDHAERDALVKTTNALRVWRTQYADPAIALMGSGEIQRARSTQVTTTGKNLFDDFRREQSQFADLVDRRLSDTRDRLHLFSILAIIVLLSASALAVALAILMRRWVRSSADREERRVRERESFSEVHALGALLAASSTTEDVAAVAAREARALLRASDVHVWAVGDRNRLRLAGSTDTNAEDGVAPAVLALSDANAPADTVRTGRPAFFSNRTQFGEAYSGWLPTLVVQHADAVAVAPARSDRRVVGSIEIYYAEPHDFDDVDRTLIELTADQIGNALARAQTHEREHEAAATLQDSLLGPPVLVEGAGHSVRYLPAEAALHIGGDWHNTQRLRDGRIMIAVGDVVGRGLEAATVMGQLRSAVSACALRGSSPSDLLDCLDEFAVEIPGASSTTVVLGFVDVEHQRLDYISAGHPPPVLVTPEGNVRLLDGATTWPLAIGDMKRSQPGASVEFPPGSLVVMYSDGLVERRTEKLDDGIARLIAAVESRSTWPLDALCDGVLDDMLHGQRRNDDIALLALRSPASTPDLFLMNLDARPEAVGRVRERLRAWLDTLGLDPDDQLTVLVAVGEACTNAVEHAYGQNDRSVFRVEACREGASIVCCITDAGAWKDNASRAARGNGLAIMRELMDEVVITRRPIGTAITLRYRPGVRDAEPVHN